MIINQHQMLNLILYCKIGLFSIYNLINNNSCEIYNILKKLKDIIIY